MNTVNPQISAWDTNKVRIKQRQCNYTRDLYIQVGVRGGYSSTCNSSKLYTLPGVVMTYSVHVIKSRAQLFKAQLS